MQPSKLILMLNAALDSGAGDEIPMEEVSLHIAAEDVIPWLNQQFPDMDLSLLTRKDIADYHSALLDISLVGR